MIADHENLTGIKFDVVVKIRPDDLWYVLLHNFERSSAFTFLKFTGMALCFLTALWNLRIARSTFIRAILVFGPINGVRSRAPCQIAIYER